MTDTSESYSFPGLSETLSSLNTFGAIIVSSLYFLVVALVLIFLIHKFAHKFLFPRLANKRYAFVLVFTLYALVLVCAGLLVLDRLGFDTQMLTRVSLMLVIALAAVIFVIAPYLPALPFKLGDMVELGGATGNIKFISPVFTRIQMFNGRTAFVPTASIWAKNVINYHFTPTRRVELALKVSADHSLADARTLLSDIMHSDPRVKQDPAPNVRVNAISAEGVDMLGLCWVDNADFLTARSDLYTKVVDATQSQEGISLALDRQQVVLSGEVTNR